MSESLQKRDDVMRSTRRIWIRTDPFRPRERVWQQYILDSL